jgi:hypothetical protein
MSGLPCGLTRVLFATGLSQGIAGAVGARLSLRPLIPEGQRNRKPRAKTCRVRSARQRAHRGAMFPGRIGARRYRLDTGLTFVRIDAAPASRGLRNPCHDVGPVFLEPGHRLGPIDDALEGFPGWVSRDSDCSRFAAYSTRSCKRSYPRRRSRESAIAALAHPRWARSIMLRASASLNQGVASKSMQRTLSAVWQVAWIIGFLRSPASNLR